MNTYVFAENRAIKLCDSFLRLDVRERERILGMVEALDFAKHKIPGISGVPVSDTRAGTAEREE
jgi:hypothetical protein